MKARKLVIAEPFKVAYEELEFAEPGAGEVIARTILSGISHGTEMTSYKGTSPFIHKKMVDRYFVPKEPGDPSFYPFRWAGYDNIAVVEQVGPGCTHLKAGDRIWSSNQHQTHVRVNEGSEEIAKLPPDLAPEDAVMTALTSVALTAINDADIHVGDVAAVFGGGVVGQLAAQLALVNGARRVFLVEPLESRRKIAQMNSSVETIDPAAALPVVAIRNACGGRGPDIIVECSGSVAGLQSAVQTANAGGTVVAAGFYASPATQLCFGDEFLHNRITIKASMGVWGCPYRMPFWDRRRSVQEAVALIHGGKLRFNGFASAKVPFDRAAEAYQMIDKEPAKYLKVMLTY